jgi:hypothetical protein
VGVHDQHKQGLAGIHPSLLKPTGNGSSVPIAVSKGASYFVQVQPARQHDAAPYRVDVRFQPATVVDHLQLDDSPSAATALTLGEDTRATVGFGGDLVDYYRLECAADATIELGVRNLHVHADVANGALGWVHVLDSQRRQVAQIHPSLIKPSLEGWVTFRVTAKSVWFIKIEVAQPQHAVPYQLTVRSR